ncbi:helix-turn-helix transcriptional regulator [Glycomyces albus]
MDYSTTVCDTDLMPQQPTLARRSLGAAFRRLREATGQTPKEVGEALGLSRQTVGRIENGEQATHILQARGLCDHFGVTGSEKSHLCDLAVRGKEAGWWESYVKPGARESTRPDFPLFLETEQVAVHIRSLEIEMIPGLLQTPEYLREVQAAQLPMSPEVAESVRALRAHRQQLMQQRTDEPRLEFLVSRAALDYLEEVPGDVAVEQRNRLLKAVEEERAQIRVITRLHAGTTGPFWILTPPDETRPFVYIDDLDGCRYIEKPEVVSLYERAFGRAWERSVPIEEYLR